MQSVDKQYAFYYYLDQMKNKNTTLWEHFQNPIEKS